jgi:hypothetical protein
LFTLPLVRVELCLAIGFLLLFAVLGPLGTYNVANLPLRFAYWGLCAITCWPICRGHDAMILYVTRSWTPSLIVLATTFGTLITAIPCAAVVATLYRAFFGHLPPPTIIETYVVLAQILVGSITLLHYIGCQFVKLRFSSSGMSAVPSRAPLPERVTENRQREPLRTVAAERVLQDGSEPPERFLRHLPGRVGRDIVAMKAAEHYVDVTTTKGTALILMRFGDAVIELGHLGVRVHRSHWVAFRHAEHLDQVGNRIYLRLSTGQTVPVSRTYLDAVRKSLKRRPRHRELSP